MSPRPPTNDPIVVSAVEIVSPIGSDFATFAKALIDGASAIRPEPEGAPLRLAARIGDFGAKQLIAAGSLRRMPRATQLGLVAAKRLIDGSGVAARYPSERIGLVIGTGLGTLEETITFQRGYLDGGPEAASPMLFPVSVMNAPAGQIAVELGLRGVNSTVNHRDGSPLGALLYGIDTLRFGRADAVLVGAIDELGLVASDAYARLADPSSRAMSPYDRDRDGQVPGELATMLLLERASDLAARGGKALGRLAAWAQTGDDRPRLGWGKPRAWPGAVEAVARVAPGKSPGQSIDWIVGGGNGTALDESELLVYHGAFGTTLPPVSSALGQLGECMASALGRVAAALVGINHDVCLGTVGTEHPIDPAVLTGNLARPIGSALVASFAMGGANLALRVERA